MFCDEALDTVEAIAAGDLTPDGRVASHLATCPNCALALTRARQLEASLQRRAVAGGAGAVHVAHAGPHPPRAVAQRSVSRRRLQRRDRG